jgi:hypothetical protein
MVISGDSATRRWPRSRPLALVAGAGFLLPVALTFAIGHFFAFVVSMGAGLLACLVVLGAGLWWMGAHVTGTSENRPARIGEACRILLLAIVCVLAQLTGILAALFVHESQVKTAKDWCEGLGPRLEEWRTRTGEYPQELSSLGNDLDPPRMCQSGLLYSAEPDGYTFDFSDGGLFSGWYYSSQRGSWSRYD